jgi:hypothetical protein
VWKTVGFVFAVVIGILGLSMLAFFIFVMASVSQMGSNK